MTETKGKPLPTGEGMTFEKVWATIQEVAELQRESRREWEESRRKSELEWEESRRKSELEWQKIREESRETTKQMEESRRKSELEWEESKRKSRQEWEESRRKSELEWEESRRKSELEWEKIREESRETTRKMQETDRQMKETDKKMKENAEWLKKYEIIVDNSNKQNGELSNSFGEMVEHLVRPGIEDRLNELGYHFSEVSPEHEIKGENRKTIAEIDILLENAETIMAVEVKSKPRIKDIKEHINRLKILRETRDKKNDKRKIMGAIAGAVFKVEAKTAALEAGFYVIKQSGDTMKMDIPKDFVPKAF